MIKFGFSKLGFTKINYKTQNPENPPKKTFTEKIINKQLKINNHN